MSCQPETSCQPAPPALGLVPPAAGQVPLRRRAGEYDGFVRDLIARVERELVDGDPLGRDWDVEGDPLASTLAGLWAYVAELVAAYAELTAAEAYLSTASDWTDLRRLAALVGYRPRPPVAAQGWVRVAVDKGADPLLPAGTRVQAPGTPQRAAQTFEVAEDTLLHADWDQLTATWVPVSVLPEGRRVRFLGDPGFRTGDQVLFVEEEKPVSAPCGDPPVLDSFWDLGQWVAWWQWLLCVWAISAPAEALAVASVVGHEDELGTSLVEFDRDLDGILSSATAAYAAYRVTQTAGEARRLGSVLRVTDTAVVPADVSGAYTSGPSADPEARTLVLDASLEGLSRDQTVAIVDWSSGDCDILTVEAHEPVSWEVAPGTPTRASRLRFAEDAGQIATLLPPSGPLTAYVVDRRVLARHYEFPYEPPGATANQLRLYPHPALPPARIAVQTALDGVPTWEVLACRAADAQEAVEGGQPGAAPVGLIVELVDGPPRGSLVQAVASANVALVRHGSTVRSVLGSGDATVAGQRFALPDAPVAYDVDAAGNLVPTLALSVSGVRWEEVPSLYGAGPAEVFTVGLAADGGLTARFGDGEQGARLPTARGAVTSSYRVGGGTAGEVESGAIASLLGSVRGVKKVEGAGPTSGGADQDDERRLRSLVPARARAFERAVSLGDLVDLSLGYPGVTHATAWRGAGPPGCACGAAGLHLAFLRAGTAGPRPPEGSELTALAGFLDARRDVTVPLCVCAAVLATPPPKLEVVLAVDPRRLVADVVPAVTAALLDPDGPLDALNRALGQPLDRSDVFAVLHAVAGVTGVPSLLVPGATGEVGRRPAERHELIVLDREPVVGGVPA